MPVTMKMIWTTATRIQAMGDLREELRRRGDGFMVPHFNEFTLEILFVRSGMWKF
jgi:hypothetical protein